MTCVVDVPTARAAVEQGVPAFRVVLTAHELGHLTTVVGVLDVTYTASPVLPSEAFKDAVKRAGSGANAGVANNNAVSTLA